jgi:hypothetical protein
MAIPNAATGVRVSHRVVVVVFPRVQSLDVVVDAAARVPSGECKAGFQTPSLAFGADYILGFEGVIREDLNA